MTPLIKSSLAIVLTLCVFGTMSSYTAASKYLPPPPRYTADRAAEAAPQNPLAIWLHRLHSTDEAVRREAAFSHPQPHDVPIARVVLELSHLLTDEHVPVRDAACYSLAALGSEARAAIPALVEAVKDRQRVTWAVFALTEIGAPSVNEFESLVNHPNAEVRRAGLQLLIAMRAPCSSVKKLVKRRKRDNDRLVQRWARDLAKVCR